MLEAKGLLTVEDLLSYVPFRYEDRSNVKTIGQLAPGEMATVIAEVKSAKLAGIQRRSLGLFETRFSDSSRAILSGKWFHGGYLQNVLVPGVKVALFGKIEFDSYTGELTVLHPEFEILTEDDPDGDAALHVGRVVPIYEAAGKLTTRILRSLVHRILQTVEPQADEFPAYIRQRLKLPDRWTAIRETHFPSVDADLRMLNAFRSPAQFRLILEEFFWLECGIALKRRKAKTVEGIAFAVTDSARQKIKTMLPFKPTGAQKRVAQQIADDMKSGRPMNRLLQGDVGSGKTIVAAQAAVIAIENGYQVAVLAPTEILATQHYFYFRRLLAPLEYRIGLLKGSLRAREKRETLERIRTGESQVSIGTHALIQEGVQFRNLAFVIIDEQHRFGVIQRNVLKEKGNEPDMLVMTATPIPRSLALTLYGDLDVSVIDQMPPGRRPIDTWWLEEKDRRKVYEEMRKTAAARRQVYVVYPLVEESEKSDLRAATEMAQHLQEQVFPGLRIGLLHGRMKSADKERVMAAFAAGEVQILVSTTVIEVGVDVANATLMVIEHAERFGLAQLHQLRGRVGRGAAQSRCILVANARGSPEARRRMDILCESNDGFRIAEVDLEVRGPGEII